MIFLLNKNIKCIKKKIKSNKFKILIDVGSHKGEYISSLKSKFLIDQTFGFEPNPDIFTILEKKFKSSKIKVFNYGISDKNTISFNKNLESSSSSINNLNSNSKYYKKNF